MREKVLWGLAVLGTVAILTIVGIRLGPQICGWLFRHQEPPPPQRKKGTIESGQRPIIIKGFNGSAEKANAAFKANDYPQYGNHHIAAAPDKLVTLITTNATTGRCVRYIPKPDTSYLVIFNTSDGGKIELFSAASEDFFDLVLNDQYAGTLSGDQVTFTCTNCYVTAEHPTFVPEIATCNDAGGLAYRPPCRLPAPDAATVIHINDPNVQCGPPQRSSPQQLK